MEAPLGVTIIHSGCQDNPADDQFAKRAVGISPVILTLLEEIERGEMRGGPHYKPNAFQPTLLLAHANFQLTASYRFDKFRDRHHDIDISSS